MTFQVRPYIITEVSPHCLTVCKQRQCGILIKHRSLMKSLAMYFTLTPELSWPPVSHADYKPQKEQLVTGKQK